MRLVDNFLWILKPTMKLSRVVFAEIKIVRFVLFSALLSFYRCCFTSSLTFTRALLTIFILNYEQQQNRSLNFTRIKDFKTFSNWCLLSSFRWVYFDDKISKKFVSVDSLISSGHVTYPHKIMLPHSSLVTSRAFG